MSQAQPGSLRIPTLDTGVNSAIVSEEYRATVCHILGFADLSKHVIEEYTFDEYEMNDGGIQVCLTIIEVTSDTPPALSPLLWVDWKQNPAVWGSTTYHPAVSRYLKSFLDNLGSQTPRNMHLPWYCFGYYRRIKRSLTECLETAGYEILGESEQVRFSCHSSTYRIPSKPDDLFFKACPVGSNEMLNTQLLCEFFPTDFVPFVCLVPEVHGIVTVDSGPKLDTLISDPPASKRNREDANKSRYLDCAMKHWADFQQRSSVYVPQLKARGMEVRDEAWVKEGVKEVRKYCRDHELLTPEELERFADTSDEIIEATFTQWKASGIPETVVHGDLCSDNVAQPGGPGTPFVLFDLHTAFIGCPFFDLRDPAGSRMHDGEAAYLQCWEHYVDADTINALAELGRTMEDIIEAIMVLRDKTMWSECVASELTCYIEDFLGQAKKLVSNGSGARGGY